MDGNGRTYYVDHNTRTTVWQRPSRSAQVLTILLMFVLYFDITSYTAELQLRLSVHCIAGAICIKA